MNIGENIRNARKRHGMTQSDLAEKLAVSDRAVSRWETGAAYPDVGMLAQLAVALETSADALLGVDPQRIRADVLSATDLCARLLREDKAEDAVGMLREKLAQYPNQPELMVYLARALLALTTEDAAR